MLANFQKGTKICSSKKCELAGKEQSINNFSKNRHRKDGFHTECKKCKSLYEKEYWIKTKDFPPKKNKQKMRSLKWYNLRKNTTEYKERVHDYNQSLCGRFSMYKIGSAKKRNFLFNLTLDQFDNITKQKCYLCGEYSKGKNFCGIDRIDSNIGYSIENCQPCCDMCNYGKSDWSQQEYEDHCLRVVQYKLLKKSKINE